MDDQLMLPPDIATHLEVPVSTVYGWLYHDSLPAPDREEALATYTRRWWYQSTVDTWWAAWPRNPANRFTQPDPPAQSNTASRVDERWEDLA